ncbi:AroM protein [Leclercia adecarboxylata]|uniref:AroM protein n=1 Tax=Leclercia adecarboxylata TaxID=83655 RepID=A0A4U9HPT2_9ENTR|nr:AroM protein [Leclercia adecarboxylata]
MEDYAPEAGEVLLPTLLSDGKLGNVSLPKIERALQSVIEVLDNQGYEVILLMSTAPITGLVARNAILLEPMRIIPPLVGSIVDSHQVGVIVPIEELLETQSQKWRGLVNTPLLSVANPFWDSENETDRRRTRSAGARRRRSYARLPWFPSASPGFTAKTPWMCRCCCQTCWSPAWPRNCWSDDFCVTGMESRPYIGFTSK